MKKVFILFAACMISLLAYSQGEIVCNQPTIQFTNLPEEVFAGDDASFVATINSAGLLDQLCAVNYYIYKDGSDEVLGNLADYGTLSFNVRTNSSNYTDVDITTGSGMVGFQMLIFNIKAASLGIFDSYCVARNRPITFNFNIDEYGEYRIYFTISTCGNSNPQSIPSMFSGG
ncbi:MAG: hypothetical protein HUK15_05500, partial [Bacteroidales bacterium]|nr:hypothetical protein [Bacteroidales bacterium]